MSGEGEKLFKFTPSILLENALMASRTNITFIIDLVLFWSFSHICFKEKIMAQG